MTLRAHAIESNDPLTEGQDYEAICGATVKEAHFVASFAPVAGESAGPAIEFSKGQCPKCHATVWVLRRRYWAVNGQEARKKGMG